MTKVIGSKGKIVNVQMTGMAGVMTRLAFQKKQIENNADLGVVKAGAFIEEEVKESIIGNRAEHKSVATGQFANSIEFTKTGKAQGIVSPKKETYPNSKSTTEDVALILEKGTSRLPARKHFGNTEKRNFAKVQDIIKKEVDAGFI